MGRDAAQGDLTSSAPQEQKQGNDANQDHSACHGNRNCNDGRPWQSGSRLSCKAQRRFCQSQQRTFMPSLSVV